MSNSFILGAPTRIFSRAGDAPSDLFAITGNTGNSIFRYAVHKAIGWEAPLLPWRNKNTDHDKPVVIPCANFLGPQQDLKNRAALLEKTKNSLVALGLGAQSPSLDSFPELDAGHKDFLQALKEKSKHKNIPNVGVRGPYTKKVIDHYGYEGIAEVLGCPSHFINEDSGLGKGLEKRFSRISRIAVSGGNPNKKNLRDVESFLIGKMEESNGGYVVQHPKPFVQLACGELSKLNSKQVNMYREFLKPGLSDKEFVGWASEHLVAFFDAADWMDHLKEYDLVIGTRIHGTMAALQAGVPAICVTHDSRTKEMCDFMSIPSLDAGDLLKLDSMDQVVDFVDFDGSQYDGRRRELAGNYVNFLESNDVNVSPYLKALAAS
ncbi:polysaccharide pyruvyl transferase family protein [Halomonas sp. THAF12]|uniref:polysaccharide pyruvyl transferase family protein n=1 Tax=Halomonas sp. B23F22_10 TaxID=3459515 RepID=UPI00373FA827